MQTVGLILAFLIGFLFIKRLSPRFSWTESIGFAFPIGMFFITLVMFLMDWAGIPLTSTSVLLVTALLTIASVIFAFPHRHDIIGSFLQRPDFRKVNMVWLICLLLIVCAEYSNFLKTVYFPAYDRDSMAGFDTIGFVAAQEHTYRNMSIFSGDYMPKIHQAGSYITYMPMLQLSYAYVYLLGALTSKAIPALVFLGFLFGFYGMVKRATSSDTAAMVTTFCMMMTPEMFSFSSLSNTNVIHACMASSGILYVCLWQRSHEKPLLILGCLLLAINCWLRSEGIVFVLAAVAIVLIDSWLKRKITLSFKKNACLTLLPLSGLLPFVLFQIYAHTCGLTAESIIIGHPFFDAEKAKDVFGGAVFLLTKAPYYGWTFVIFLIALLLNVIRIARHGEWWSVLIALFCPLVLYFIILYQIDYIWDSLTNVINFSAKRFLFCFVPIAWFYIVSNHIINDLFTKLDSQLSFRKWPQ